MVMRTVNLYRYHDVALIGNWKAASLIDVKCEAKRLGVMVALPHDEYGSTP